MKLYRTGENEYINLDELVSLGIYDEKTAVNFRSGWELTAVFEGIGGRYTKVLGKYSTKADAQAALDDMIRAIGSSVIDYLSLEYAAVTNDNEPDRAANTAKISSVTIDGNIITIQLSCKVSELNDFDGRGGWGVHKWLGIGLSSGVTPITKLIYNGSALTQDDVTEAGNMGLSSGYFVRWVAADLVLAGNNSEKSKDSFTLTTSGKATRLFRLVIVEGE